MLKLSEQVDDCFYLEGDLVCGPYLHPPAVYVLKKDMQCTRYVSSHFKHIIAGCEHVDVMVPTSKSQANTETAKHYPFKGISSWVPRDGRVQR